MIGTNMDYISKFAFALFCAVILSLSSCSEELDQQPLEGGGEGLPAFTDTELPPLGNTEFKFSFYSDERWTLSGVPSWLYVSPSSGNAGSTAITLSATSIGVVSDYIDNLRECTLTFKTAGGGHTINSFKVSQQRPFVHAEVLSGGISDDGLASEAAENNLDKIFKWSEYGSKTPYTIQVLSNIEWDWEMEDAERYDIVKTDAQSVSEKRYYKNSTLTVIPRNHNFDRQPNFVNLNIKGLASDGTVAPEGSVDYIHKTWAFEHKNLRFLIDDSAEDKTVDMGEVSVSYMQYDDSMAVQKIRISTEIPWEDFRYENRAQDWLKFEPNSSDSTIVFTAEHVNSADTARVKPLVISAVMDGEMVSREVNLCQRPYTLAIGSDSLATHFENVDTSSRSLPVTTKGPWRLAEYPSDWLNLKVNPENVLTDDPNGFTYRGNASITFSAPDQNLSLEDLVGQIKLVAVDDVESLREIRQARFAFDFFTPDLIQNMPALGESGRVPVGVDCSGAWEIVNASDFDWIKFSVAGADGKTEGLSSDKTFDVEIQDANPYEDRDRVAALTLVSLTHKSLGMDVTKTLEVRQRKYTWEISSPGQDGPSISYSLKAYDPDFDGGSAAAQSQSYPLTIKCSGTWRIDNAPAWFVPTESTGTKVDGGQTIYFKPVGNTGSAQRTATFYVNDITKTENKQAITVTQDGFVFKLVSGQRTTFSDIPVMAGRDGYTFSVSFEHTTDSPYSFSPMGTWLRESATKSVNGRTQTTTITFSPQDNPNSYDRTSNATLRSTFSNSQFAFSFAQKKYEFDSTPVSYEFAELAGSDGRVENLKITCSGDWTINNPPAWVSLSETAGREGKTITIRPTDNVSTSPRAATTFYVRSTLTGQSKAVTLSQKAFKFDATEVRLTYNPLEIREDRVEVRCSGKWHLNNLPTWVSASVNYGSGSQAGATDSFTLTSTQNLTKTTLNARAEVVSDDNPALVRLIYLTQNPYQFSVATNSLSFVASPTASQTVDVVCTGRWTCSSSDTWLTATQSGSNGDGKITVSALKNSTKKDRSATITLKSESFTEVINVTQKK